MHSKTDQGLTFNFFFATCLAIVTVQSLRTSVSKRPFMISLMRVRTWAAVGRQTWRDKSRGSAKKDRRASEEEGTTPRRDPRVLPLCLARVRRVSHVWQKITDKQEGRAALGLPGRTARSRPTDSTCSISSRRHPRSRWTLLDGRPPCRPAETRDFSGAMITMTPRYMHPTRDKAIWPSLNVDNEKRRPSLPPPPLGSVSFLLEANAGTSCGLRRWQYESSLACQRAS